MNPISAFFVENIIAIFFVYGLAFFSLGLALASRRASEFTFVRVIRPLAAFGLLHGLHEWIEMFQQMAGLVSGYTPPIWHELIRLAVLAGSFVVLAAFGVRLLAGEQPNRGRISSWDWLGCGGWSVGATALALRPPLAELVALADVLAAPSNLAGRLNNVLQKIVHRLTFPEADMILLVKRDPGVRYVRQGPPPLLLTKEANRNGHKADDGYHPQQTADGSHHHITAEVRQ